MEKKKSSTIILIVIVIVLIIVAIFLFLREKTINEVKLATFETNTNKIITASENRYTSMLLSDGIIETTKYEYENGVQKRTEGNIQISYSGDGPKNGTLIINKTGEISLAFYDHGHCITKTFNDIDIKVEKTKEINCKIKD